MDHFQVSGSIFFGKDALYALKKLKGRRILVVTDPFFHKNGVAQRIAALCEGEASVFSNVVPDPPLRVVAEGLTQMNAFGADTLIALGGGSAIDCAKGMVSMGKERPYFVAIPTTSGTGSEVTAFAILTHEGVKHPLVDPTLRPDMAILDESLLDELPPSLIADGGMDVIAHCVEALGGKNRSPFSEALAVSAFERVMRLLPRSYEGDTAVRGELHCAATMAGIAFDHGGLGICHGLSHALGGRFHIPHGKLNAILLPQVMTFNKGYAPYSLLGGNPVFAVTRLRRRLRMPESLTGAGIPREALHRHMDELCEAALADPCTATNPRPLTMEDCRGILRACI